SHGPDLPAEQRTVHLPVDLLVLEAHDRHGRIRAGLEGSSLPTRDEIGAVLELRSRRGHVELADHPAAARKDAIRWRGYGHGVRRLAIARRSRLSVRRGDRRVGIVVGSRHADVAAEVGPVAGVADADL